MYVNRRTIVLKPECALDDVRALTWAAGRRPFEFARGGERE